MVQMVFGEDKFGVVLQLNLGNRENMETESKGTLR